MDKNQVEKNIERIQRFGISCNLNDNGKIRYFHNGYEYIEIGGIKWATCNIGAKNPTDSGLYFAWGETVGFTAEQVLNGERQFNWENCKYYTSYGKQVLDPIDDAATVNWGKGYMMPTKEEFKNLVKSTTHKWIGNYQGSGVNGILFTDKIENSKVLFFPASGYCYKNRLEHVHKCCAYWTSSTTSKMESNYMYYDYNNRDLLIYSIGRLYGFHIRPIVV